MTTTVSNRRLAPRLSSGLEVSFRVVERPGAVGRGKLVDISSGGLRVDSYRGILVGRGELVELWTSGSKSEASEILDGAPVFAKVMAMRWSAQGQVLNLKFDPTRPGWHRWFKYAAERLAQEVGR